MSSDVIKTCLTTFKWWSIQKTPCLLNIINRPRRGIGIKSTEELLNNALDEDMSVIEYLYLPHL